MLSGQGQLQGWKGQSVPTSHHSQLSWPTWKDQIIQVKPVALPARAVRKAALFTRFQLQPKPFKPDKNIYACAG